MPNTSLRDRLYREASKHLTPNGWDSDKWKRIAYMLSYGVSTRRILTSRY